MSILTALPGTRPSLRSFSMDEWPQGGAKMRGGRSMRWAQVSAPAGARMELVWENINYAQAELISAVWDANYGTYGNLQLAGETLAGLAALSSSILVTLSGDQITTLAGDLITTDAAISSSILVTLSGDQITTLAGDLITTDAAIGGSGGGSGLADLIEQPFPDAIWRFEGPPVVEAVKAGRCTVRLLLRTRRDLRPDAILPGPATPLTTPFIVVPASVIRTRALAPEVVGTLIGTSVEVPALEAITVSLLAPEVVGSAFFPPGVDVPAITVTATVLAPEVVGSVVPSSVDVPTTAFTVTALAPEVVGSELAPTLLLHFDGADGSTTFTDSGTNVYTVTPSGAAEISTAQSKFGGASGWFDGTASTRLDIAYDADLKFEGDFCVDGWQYLTGTSGFGCLLEIGTFSDGLIIRGNGTTFANGTQIGGIPYVANTWRHIALTRSGADCRLFLDGVLRGTQVISGTTNTANGALRVAGAIHANQLMTGYIDELRIVKGNAVWTADFTPPTAPYADP